MGGSSEVGRSAYLLKTGEANIAFDYGIKVHEKVAYPVSQQGIDAVVLSHAHLDHSGCIPMLYKHANIPTICTPPTAPIAELLCKDVIKVAKAKGNTPPYAEKDIVKMTKNFTKVPYGKPYEFFDGTTIEFFDAGHILGSAQTLVHSNGKKLLYTADIQRTETRMHKGAFDSPEKVDVMITESTYGNREHPPRKQLEKDFCEAIEDVLSLGQPVIVPCFAVGRTQELLEILASREFGVPIYVDGMGSQICEIYGDFAQYTKNPSAVHKALGKARGVEHGERKKIIQKAGIVLCTAGMLEGGPVLDYIDKLNKTGKGKIMLTGYQAKDTNGRSLLDEGTVKNYGKKMRVNLPVEFWDFSAHAGSHELVEHVKKTNPGKVYCVHGDPDNCNGLKEKLIAEGFDAFAPIVGEQISI